MALTPAKVLPLKGVRKLIAERMRVSLAGTAQVTLHRWTDVVPAAQDRVLRPTLPSWTAYFAKAFALALKEMPLFNSHLVGEEIFLFEEVHLGIAVQTQDGLVVPVLRHASEGSLADLDGRIRELADRARRRLLTLTDLADTTASLSNLGMYGIDFFTPILNPPQTCILGVGRVRENGGRQEVGLSLTFDHQVVDGALAAQFLDKVAGYLADPGVLG